MPTSEFVDAETFQKIQPIEFLRRFLSQEVRPDGRKFNEFRLPLLHLNPVSIGSCTVKIGNNTVICGIKAEIAKPLPTEPNRGFFIPNVELSPISSSKFKPGAPSAQAQAISQRIDDLFKNVEIFDKKQLKIDDQYCWIVYADMICLQYDGSIIDACLLSLMASLQNRIFLLIVVTLPVVEIEDGKCNLVENQDAIPLEVEKLVFSSSFCVFDGIMLMDPTDEEETLSSSQITIMLDHLGNLCGIHKTGDSMSKEEINNCILNAKTKNLKFLEIVQG